MTMLNTASITSETTPYPNIKTVKRTNNLDFTESGQWHEQPVL